MNILNLGYASTNYYLIEPDRVGLLVDIGWPGTMGRLNNVLKRKGVAFEKIRYLLATHYHPDHAGLAQEMKDRGVRLIVMDTQVEWIPKLAMIMKPEHHYHDISLTGNIDLTEATSRAFLKSIGLDGEIISTPGHTDDSVTLILDEGFAPGVHRDFGKNAFAFTGDLPPQNAATDEARAKVEESWRKIRSRNVKTVYPAHG